LEEALLYAYYAINYLDEEAFRAVLGRTNRFQGRSDLQRLLGGERSYQKLVNKGHSREKLEQKAFEVSIKKDYIDVSVHFLETTSVYITWELVRYMILRKRIPLVKKCVKLQVRFDPTSSGMRKILFAGSLASTSSRAIKVVDFVQIMLEQHWSSDDIKKVLNDYVAHSKIDPQDVRELFLMCAIKRKLKLMSFLINERAYDFTFQEINFIDVLENNALDMAVLLYREYFLILTEKYENMNKLLVDSFNKSNGQLEAKCFLIKRFMGKMNY